MLGQVSQARRAQNREVRPSLKEPSIVNYIGTLKCTLLPAWAAAVESLNDKDKIARLRTPYARHDDDVDARSPFSKPRGVEANGSLQVDPTFADGLPLPTSH